MGRLLVLNIVTIKQLWDSSKRKQRRLEAMFKTEDCEFRKSLTTHQVGSTALAMKTCCHKKHPYAKTQFTKKCAIELCPMR